MFVPPGDAPVLVGRLVRLEPLSPDHVAGLALAGSEDRESYGFTTVPDAHGAAAYVADMCARHDAMPFAQVQTVGRRVVGSTSFLNFRWRSPDGPLDAVEIGATWLAASVQGGGINKEAKLLLLAHALEVWKVARVDLKTDARNAWSRRAIEGIGAQFEGVLRSWQPSHARGEQSALRDSAMFSIVAAEWPSVAHRLQELLLQTPGAAG